MIHDVYTKSKWLSRLAGLPVLKAACDEAIPFCQAAAVCKIEGMLLQAAKSKMKRTQKEIITAQFQDIAGSDLLDEGLIQPALLQHSRGFLD